MLSRSESQSNPSKQKEIARRSYREMGGWWHRWRRRGRWIANVMQREKIRSISRRASSRSITIKTVPPLIRFFIVMILLHVRPVGRKKRFGTCICPNNGASHEQFNTTDFISDNSMRGSWCAASCCLRSLTSVWQQVCEPEWAGSPCWLWLTPLR